jgi:hypothetical protein
VSVATVRAREAGEPGRAAFPPPQCASHEPLRLGNACIGTNAGANAAALARQSLLAQVRRQTEQLRRRAERAGTFARVTAEGLARAELQRYLDEAGPNAGQDAASRCLVLLACVADGGTVISIDVFEKCRALAEQVSDPALRALFFTCARRLVLGGPEKEEGRKR